MTEPQQPKAAPTNNQNSLDDHVLNEIGVLLQEYDNASGQKEIDQAISRGVAAINKTILEARINQCQRLDPYIDPEFRELYEQELEELTKKYGRADNE